MAFLTDSGSFAVSTGAAGTTQDITCTDAVGGTFQPKAVLLYVMGGRTEGTDTVGAAGAKCSIGFGTTGSNRYCVSSAVQHNAAAGTGSKRMSDLAIMEILDIAGGAGIEGGLDLDTVGNWPATGFRVIVDEQFTNAYIVGWVAWGGSDITNATCVLFQEPAATGNQDITTPGFTVTDGNGVVILISMADATVPAAGFISGVNGRAGKMMIGAATSPTEQAVLITNDDEGSATIDGTSYCSDILAVAMIPDTGSTTVDARATFNAWITNGFQLNWAERISTRYIAALVIKGGKWEVGNLLTQTDTTTNIVEGSFGFAPKSTFVVSAQKAKDTADTAAAHDQISFGAFTSASNRHCQSYLNINGGANSVVQTAIEYDECYANLTTAALEGLMDVVSIDSGGFTLKMDDADPTAMFAWYVSAGQTPASVTEEVFFKQPAQVQLPCAVMAY